MIPYDPYTAARRSAEKEWMNVVMAIMKKQGITQIDLSDVELFAADGLTLTRSADGRFLRIKGEFQLERIEK